ncbi:MAG: hypothetical protein IJ274_14250, partial [Lachnospiraceae bacterium]|nr:hypothetical protein [Lachnospiraceae bacterium]
TGVKVGYNQTSNLWKTHKQRDSETMTRRSTPLRSTYLLSVKKRGIPCLCGFPRFFIFFEKIKNVVLDRYKPFESKKSGVKSGVVKLMKKPAEMRAIDMLHNLIFYD